MENRLERDFQISNNYSKHNLTSQREIVDNELHDRFGLQTLISSHTLNTCNSIYLNAETNAKV